MGAPLLPPDEPGTDRYFGEIRPHIVMGWRPPEEVTEAPNGFPHRRRGLLRSPAEEAGREVRDGWSARRMSAASRQAPRASWPGRAHTSSQTLQAKHSGKPAVPPVVGADPRPDHTPAVSVTVPCMEAEPSKGVCSGVLWRTPPSRSHAAAVIDRLLNGAPVHCHSRVARQSAF